MGSNGLINKVMDDSTMLELIESVAKEKGFNVVRDKYNKYCFGSIVFDIYSNNYADLLLNKASQGKNSILAYLKRYDNAKVEDSNKLAEELGSEKLLTSNIYWGQKNIVNILSNLRIKKL